MKGIQRLLTGFVMIVLSLLTPLEAGFGSSIYEEAPPVPSLQRSGQVVEKVRIGRPQKMPLLYGKASWYSQTDPGIKIHTANGEIFNDAAKTCAAWDIPFGTRLKVTNVANGKSVVCRVNDRGPNKRLDRKIDLSKASFRQIADLRRGIIQVLVEIAA